MSGYSIPLPDAAADAAAFLWHVRDLHAADVRLAKAKREYDDESRDLSKNGGLEALARATSYSQLKPTTQELLYKATHGRTIQEAREEERLKPWKNAVVRAEAERDDIRRSLDLLADRLRDAAIDVGVLDTAPLTRFRQTWTRDDILSAVALVENVASRAWLAMRRDDLPAVVSRSLTCLDSLIAVEREWWGAKHPPPPSFLPEFGPDGKPTPEHSRRVAEFLDRRADGANALKRRIDDLRAEIRKLSAPLMALAVRPEIGEPPERLRNLLDGWSAHIISNPDDVQDARNFLCNLSLKLATPAVAKALSMDAQPPPVALSPSRPLMADMAEADSIEDREKQDKGQQPPLYEVEADKLKREGHEIGVSPQERRLLRLLLKKNPLLAREAFFKSREAPWHGTYKHGRDFAKVQRAVNRMNREKLGQVGLEAKICREHDGATIRIYPTPG